MNNHFRRPPVAESFVCLTIRHRPTIIIGERLQTAALGDRKFSYKVISVGQVDFVLPAFDVNPTCGDFVNLIYCALFFAFDIIAFVGGYSDTRRAVSRFITADILNACKTIIRFYCLRFTRRRDVYG